MPMSAATFLGLTTRFVVVVDQVKSLGGWARCKGLAVDFKPEFQLEGGNYETRTVLPGHIEYPPVTLERPMNAQDSGTVMGWLSERAANWASAANSGGGSSIEITLLDMHGKKVTSWTLRNAFPASWKGPDLDAMSAGVALEVLTLVHEGFL